MVTQSATRPAAAGLNFRSRGQKIEDFILQLILLVPVFGLGYSPEQYLRPDSSDMFQSHVGAAALKYPFTAAVTHFVTLFIFLLVARHWRRYLYDIRYAGLVLLQFMVIASSAAWSPEPFISLQEAYHLLLFVLLAMHVASRYSAVEFIGILNRLLTISGIACLCSVVLIPQYSHSVGLTGYENAYRGLYLNKNWLATMSGIAIVTSAYSFLIKQNSTRLIVICFISNALMLLLSRSATSSITALIGLIFVIMAYSLQTNIRRIILLMAGAGAALLLAAAINSVADPMQLLGRSSDLTGRTDIWAAVIPLIHARPLLGYGLGFWQFDTLEKNNIWAQVGFAVPHSHNDVLDILLQTGVIGLAFFALNMGLCMAAGLARIRKIQDGSMMCLIYMLSFLVNGLTEGLSLTDDSRAAFVLFCFQIYIWKLAFPRRTSRPAFAPKPIMATTLPRGAAVS